jgi:hypothetical protein
MGMAAPFHSILLNTQTPIDFIGFSRFELKKIPADYVPTADQLALVENAAAFGLTQADSAGQLKIDEKTLRKHFQDELSSGKFQGRHDCG